MAINLKSILWETDVKKIDLQKNYFYVIERILEYGNLKQIVWMQKKFPNDKITNVIKNSRRLSLKSANFWVHFYNIKETEVKCLNKLFLKTQRNIWPY